MDIFNPTDAPQDIAISQAIDGAVEMLIAGNVEKSNHYFEMAESFTQAPKELFTPDFVAN